MNLALFSFVCCLLALALLLTINVRTFAALQTGRRYRTVRGDLVTIVDIKLWAMETYVFVGDNGQQYFETGHRVGYIYENDLDRLIRRV